MPNAIEILLDGQRLFLPDADLLASLRAGEEWQGMRAPSLDILWKKYDEISDLSDAVLAFGKAGEWRDWFPYFLFSINGSWQRVEPRHARCPLCNWQGLVAYVDGDGYIGVPDKQRFHAAAQKYPSLGCPSCGSKKIGPLRWVLRDDSANV